MDGPPAYASSSVSTTAPATTLVLAESNETPFLLNLMPLAPSISFQCGFLGAGPASLQGEVQLKFLAPGSSSPAISKVSVTFRGVESDMNGDAIELVEIARTLWDSMLPETSRDGAQRPSVDLQNQPPAIMPFKLDLTPDLPHCLHLGGRAGLSYCIEARVECLGNVASVLANDSVSNSGQQSSNVVSVKVPVHLTRFSKRGEPLTCNTATETYSLSPTSVSISSPTSVKVTLFKSLLRSGEPLALRVKILAPDPDTMKEKGLRLRSVSAEFRRHVWLSPTHGVGQETQSPITEDANHGSELMNGAEATSAPPYDIATEQISSLSSPPSRASTAPSTTGGPIKTTRLAFSGKSCRFSPHRPVLLHITLHPKLHPTSDPGMDLQSDSDVLPSPIMPLACESITQSTIIYSVTFSVEVVVHIAGREGERLDIKVEKGIGLVPNWPPDGDKEKAKETMMDPELTLGSHSDDNVPSYFAMDRTDQLEGPSGTATRGFSSDEDQDDEEEYDGYEEFSSHAGQGGPAPPPIDDDVPPPPAPLSPSGDAPFLGPASAETSASEASDTTSTTSSTFGEAHATDLFPYTPLDITPESATGELDSLPPRIEGYRHRREAHPETLQDQPAARYGGAPSEDAGHPPAYTGHATARQNTEVVVTRMGGVMAPPPYAANSAAFPPSLPSDAANSS